MLIPETISCVKFLILGQSPKSQLIFFLYSFPVCTKFFVGHNFAVSDEIAMKLVMLVCHIK